MHGAVQCRARCHSVLHPHHMHNAARACFGLSVCVAGTPVPCSAVEHSGSHVPCDTASAECCCSHFWARAVCTHTSIQCIQMRIRAAAAAHLYILVQQLFQFHQWNGGMHLQTHNGTHPLKTTVSDLFPTLSDSLLTAIPDLHTARLVANHYC